MSKSFFLGSLKFRGLTQASEFFMLEPNSRKSLKKISKQLYNPVSYLVRIQAILF